MPIQSTLGRLTADARAALRAGDLLRVCDIALDSLQPGANGFASADTDGFALAKMHVLAHARMGNTAEAAALYGRYRLAEADDLDAQALAAWLAKDKAFAVDSLDFNKVRNASPLVAKLKRVRAGGACRSNGRLSFLHMDCLDTSRILVSSKHRYVCRTTRR
jgi:hypothetical protein